MNIRKLTQDLSANSHKIHTQIHTRFIRKFTQDLFENLSPNAMRKCDILPPQFYHSFLTIALISELLNINENQCEIVPIPRFITHFSL